MRHGFSATMRYQRASLFATDSRGWRRRVAQHCFLVIEGKFEREDRVMNNIGRRFRRAEDRENRGTLARFSLEMP